jgi:hypothetical protein
MKFLEISLNSGSCSHGSTSSTGPSVNGKVPKKTSGMYRTS